MHENNKLCMLQTGRKKTLEVLKRIKTILSTFLEINLPWVFDEEN